MSLESAVRSALDEHAVTPPDKGTAELALTYARAVDDGGELERLGPLLLTALESLLMSPKARAAVVKGAKDERPKSPLDELRTRRARKSGTANLDAAAT